MIMKPTITSLVVFASLFVLGVAPDLYAGEERTCTNGTLEGPYGAIANGTVFGQGLTALVGVITFDGTGNQSIAGTNVSEDRGVQQISDIGTYTVNPDCTGSSVFGTGRTFDFVIVDGGNEILQIATLEEPRRVVTWVLKKQFPRHHDDQE
jgi:hypothetical protein